MKRISGHFLAKHFFAFVFAAFIGNFSPQAAIRWCLEINCWTSFEPDPEWSYHHPGCVPEVFLNEHCVPTAELLDCSAGSGTVVIGELMVYDGSEPLTLYRVISEDGNVITVLIEEF